jgi:hypothetical protein
MRKIAIAFVLCVVGCAVQPTERESVSSAPICEMSDDGVWTCGDQPGGGTGGGGGGLGGASCSLVPCDPILDVTDIMCSAACAIHARCMHTYRCNDWNEPDCHIGYCGAAY